MIDIQLLRENPELVKQAAEKKGYTVDVERLQELDSRRRDLLMKVESERAAKNEHANFIAGFARQGVKPSKDNLDKGIAIKQKLELLERDLSLTDEEFIKIFKQVPNIPLEDVPVGATEEENVVAKTVGEKTVFDFQPRSHAEIAEAKGWLDKERAAKVTGSRFAYIKGDLVRLQFALIQFVMDKLSDQVFIDEVINDNNLSVSRKPFLPILPPFLIRTNLYDAMDRLEPRDDRYKLENDDLWLQGSAEHVLGSMHADEIFKEVELPIRYIGYATSFRREAGTYGKDMEGMFRMHQFDKLEMESLGLAENGLEEHLFLIAIQEKIMQLLGIPYQVLMKCTADIGKPNARGVDIEAWLPSQGKYRETHTADYMTDYQARRLKTRVRRDSQNNASVELIHTNDATALPLSRGPIAIIENYQKASGDVIVPDVLRPYLGDREVL